MCNPTREVPTNIPPLYAQLPIGFWQIRVLTISQGSFEDPIETTLHKGDLLDESLVRLEGDEWPTEYYALSYCWGGTHRTYTIICNELQLEIGEAAFEALRCLREYLQEKRTYHVWIDAICINQENDQEKSQQVPRMLSVYNKAAEVLVWLGEGIEDIRSLIYHIDHQPGEAIEQLAKCYTESSRYGVQQLLDLKNIAALSPDIVVSGMESILQLPWFHRVWTKQELWAGSKVILLYQDVQCDWNNFTVATYKRLLKRHGSTPDPTEVILKLTQTLERHKRGDPVSLAKAKRDDKQNPYLSKDESLDLVNVIRRCHGSQATCIKDFIYGVMGMSTVKVASLENDHAGRESLPVNYRQADAHTFQQVAEYLMGREDNFSILFLEGAFDCRPAKKDFEACPLPSWVPDWRQLYGDLVWLTSRVKRPLSTKRRLHMQPEKPWVLSEIGGPLKYESEQLTLSGFRLGRLSSEDIPFIHLSNSFATSRVLDVVQDSRSIGFKLALLNADENEKGFKHGHELWALKLGHMLWYIPERASTGDIPVAVHGAYAPVLLRPSIDTGSCGHRYSYVGPMFIHDQSLPLRLRHLHMQEFDDNVDADTAAIAIDQGVSGPHACEINERLGGILEDLEHNELQHFAVI